MTQSHGIEPVKTANPGQVAPAAGMRVLIAGVSTRAAAESAAKAGFAVTALDAFADLDHHPTVRALSTTRDFGVPFSAAAVGRIGRTIEADAVIYLSSLDNHPRVVTALSARRPLWGNTPATLRCVRHPLALASALRRQGFAVPTVHVDDAAAAVQDHATGWLVKPLASGGGHGVRAWTPGTLLPRRSYLQQRIDGVPGSIVFVSAAGVAVPIGFSRQLVGVAALGARGYRYCGNIMGAAGDAQFADDDRVFASACALAGAATRHCGLVGVNGIDFIARDGAAFPIEVNPRWSSSMELAERAYHISVFGLHAAACATGIVPSFDLARARGRAGALGKAIVFAHRDSVAPDTREWLADPNIRDVPHPGERIGAGRPICTLLASAADSDACERRLLASAERIYAALTHPGRARHGVRTMEVA